MKRFLSFFIALAAALLVSGCSKEIDWAPVELIFSVQDSEGRDLLDPSSDLYIGDDLTLTHEGREYYVMLPTKVLAPSFYGLVVTAGDGCYFAKYGEMDGGVNYDDDFIVSFPDGSTRTIHYDRRINSFTIKAHKQWRLDGKKVDLPIRITY